MYSSLRIATRARRPPPGDRLHRYRRQAEPDGLFPPRVARTQRGRLVEEKLRSVELRWRRARRRATVAGASVRAAWGEPLIKRESNQSPQ